MNIIRRFLLLFGQYRELLFHLSLKNLKIQYKYAILGFLWSLFLPLSLAVIFWFVFGVVFNRSVGPLYLMIALFPWNFIQMSINGGTSSVIEGRDLIRKVYFPREILPLSVVLSNFINFIFAMAVVMLLIVAKRLWVGEGGLISVGFLLVPVFMLIIMVFTCGISLIVSCGQVYFRDVRYLVEVSLLLWFYLSPVFYDIAMVKRGIARLGMPFLYRLYLCNPFTCVLLWMRHVLRVGDNPALTVDMNLLLIYALGSSFCIFFFGYWLFTRYDHEYADMI
jgi:lipopolysaccharide transport system permease protein